MLFLIVDEFGKFLEYASQNEPKKELYFIQQLAEFVNNSDLNIVLYTTVHQNFDAYALSLTQSQKQEWTKVKGRFKEITFNEPVEQLLFLASEHLTDYNCPTCRSKMKKLFENKTDYYGDLIYRKCKVCNDIFVKNHNNKYEIASINYLN